MKEYCTKNNIEYRFVPQYHSPRASFTSYLYTILKVLHSTFKIKQENILESIKEMKKTRDKIMSSNLSNENPALQLAESITGIPIIYYPFGLQSAAIRFKNSLQENSKIHVMVENIVETCHNGIVSWERKSSVQPILIEGQDDYIKTKERFNIIKEFFKKNNIEYKEIISVNGSILSKIINLIYLLDYTTIYKAVLDEIDPSPVKSIDFIKSKL
jgi:glucose/mannose-6-phosphate isomerase